jgi:PAS domain-containing protein
VVRVCCFHLVLHVALKYVLTICCFFFPSFLLVPGGAHELRKPSQQRVIPSAASKAAVNQPAPVPPGTLSSPDAFTSMKPPPPPSKGVPSLQSTLSTAGLLNHGGQAAPHTAIAPMPGGNTLCMSDDDESLNPDDKKQQKRAANRRSAQLSRKRKKAFIEELKEENDELRRKEQILRSIPDLIVVFDSSGKLGFVSQSVSRFIDTTPEELEGTSFWDRLCEDSVRLLKAAFMDSMAARKADAETAALGSGVWELRLMDKDSSYSIVTLNGVVHFSGEAPECVCCIRPRDQLSIPKLTKERTKAVTNASRPVSSSDGSRSSEDSNREHPQIKVHPNQSVVSNDNSGDDSGDSNNEPSRKQLRRKVSDALNANVHQAVRISDGDSGGELSESGSDDGITSS